MVRSSLCNRKAASSAPFVCNAPGRMVEASGYVWQKHAHTFGMQVLKVFGIYVKFSWNISFRLLYTVQYNTTCFPKISYSPSDVL